MLALMAGISFYPKAVRLIRLQTQIKTHFTNLQGTKEFQRLQAFTQIVLCDGPPHTVGWVWAGKQKVYYEVAVSEIWRAFYQPQECRCQGFCFSGRAAVAFLSWTKDLT